MTNDDRYDEAPADYDPPLEQLANALKVTEARTQELDLARRRLVVIHSLTLHRDSTSVTDVEAMIRHLRDAGMPDHATLRVDGSRDLDLTRMHATWHTDPEDGARDRS
jgi:hypothetical protein